MSKVLKWENWGIRKSIIMKIWYFSRPMTNFSKKGTLHFSFDRRESNFHNLETKPGMKEHKERGLIFKEQKYNSVVELDVEIINRGHVNIEIVMNFVLSLCLFYNLFLMLSQITIDIVYLWIPFILPTFPFPNLPKHGALEGRRLKLVRNRCPDLKAPG